MRVWSQISGPVESIEKFVATLAAEGVFARRVNSSGVAFHSKYIAAAAPLLRRSLERVIPNPKPRSQRWISSSLPKDQWNSDLGNYVFFVVSIIIVILKTRNANVRLCKTANLRFFLSIGLKL